MLLDGVRDVLGAQRNRVGLAVAGLILAVPTLVIWWTTNTTVAHGPLTGSSIEYLVWQGEEIHPYLLAAVWWLAYVLIALALGRWSVGALSRVGALLLVFAIIAVAVPPPIHPPSLGGPSVLQH
jgi:hypothetical protein